MRLACTVFAFLFCFCGPVSASASGYSERVLLANEPAVLPNGATNLPDGPTILEHFKRTIVPFYMQQSALGEPYGNFPTFRCNNGQPFEARLPCRELTSKEWLVAKLGRQYTRMISRQIFTYGVIFHLTGDLKALQHARAGVDYLRKHLLDDSRGVITYIYQDGKGDQDGKAGYAAAQRTSQDLAYALLGMAKVYYLTGDPALLADLIKVKKYIFSHYRDAENDMLSWVLSASEDQKAGQQELVAQLDQINAYMLLLYPLLPATEQVLWKEDLVWLANVLRDRFHADDEQRFYGYIHEPSGKLHQSRHGDFGHTSKAYWMLYLLGKELNDEGLENWAEQGLLSVFDRAYGEVEFMEIVDSQKLQARTTDRGERTGYWRSHENTKSSAWWEYAELDQAAWTLSLKHPELDQMIALTYSTWMNGMVDYQYGGTWLFLNGVGSPKAFHWKNGYHESERSLVLYLLSSAKHQHQAQLYFALPRSLQQRARPYYFRSGEVSVIEVSEGIQKMVFSGIE